jgi:hypothetical protein
VALGSEALALALVVYLLHHPRALLIASVTYSEKEEAGVVVAGAAAVLQRPQIRVSIFSSNYRTN